MEFITAVDSNGMITEVKWCNPPDRLYSGQSVLDIFSRESAVYIMAMLRNASGEVDYANKQLQLAVDNHPVTVHALTVGCQLVLFGFANEDSVEELVRIYNEFMNELRVEFKRVIQEREHSVQAQFEQIQGLNNELTNSQRALEKANSKLNQMNTELRRQFALEKRLSEISADFARCEYSTREGAIQRALASWGQFLDVDRVYIYQFHDTQDELHNKYLWCAKKSTPLPDKRRTISCDHTWWLPKIQEGKPISLSGLDSCGVESMLIQPLVEDNVSVGFIGMDCTETKRDWTASEISYSKILADVIGNAMGKQKVEEQLIENVEALNSVYEKLDEEFHRARKVHERTMPHSYPDVGNICMYPYYAPAAKIGGDFYNVVQVGNRLLIYLSDVTGHGLEGALFSVFVKEAIASYVSLRPDALSPREILTHLDTQYRQENYPADYFVSIFLGVLELDTLEFTYSGAGFQDTPFVAYPDGKRKKLQVEGLPITSVVSPALMNFSEQRITLKEGTTVLFNTDGLTEQTIQGVAYYSRLDQVFYKHSHLPCETIGLLISQDFQEFNGGNLQGADDVTFLVMKIQTGFNK